MTVGLYMDVHIPAPITEGLRHRNVNVLTAQEDGHRRTKDPQLLDRASSLSRPLFTMDEGLLAEAAKRQENGTFFCGVIYCHQGRLTFREAIEQLETLAIAGEVQDFQDHVFFLHSSRL